MYITDLTERPNIYQEPIYPENTTFAIRMVGEGVNGNIEYVTSDARLNLVLIANLPPFYTNDPNVDQLVIYNETRQINATDFIEYKECSITCEPETLYIWNVNIADIKAEIPDPKTATTSYPPVPGAGIDIIQLTTTLLPSGDIITHDGDVIISGGDGVGSGEVARR